jgi:hypothetical protein
MKALALSVAVLALSCSLCAFAQPLVLDGASVLELHLEPVLGQNKIPIAFTVSIVNKGNREIHLPMPNRVCADVPYGTVKLHVNYRRYVGGLSAPEGGCFSDYGYTPILDRINGWRTLHPGQSLLLKNASVLAQDAGTYDVWASYDPPGMPKADEEVLQKAGIDFPRVRWNLRM